MAPQLERLCRQRKNFRILKVDIEKWSSPVAQQYGIRRLPSLWLYEGTELKSEDSREVLEFLQRG